MIKCIRDPRYIWPENSGLYAHLRLHLAPVLGREAATMVAFIATFSLQAKETLSRCDDTATPEEIS